jgi:hypothetical protein
MGEWYVIVCDIVEEMDFFLLQEKSCGNRVNWCISPSLIKETSILVEALKEIEICF